MLKLAEAQSEKGSPLSLLSVLTFQDLVEWFCLLSCEHLHIVVGKDDSFDKRLNLIGERVHPGSLQFVGPMQKLNKARVQLKHSGIFPGIDFVHEIRSSVSQFLGSNCPLVFGVSFESVSLCDLVEMESPRTRLKEALSCLESGEIDRGLGEVAIAFEDLIQGFESANSDRFEGSPYRFGGDLRKLTGIASGLRNTGGERSTIWAIEQLGKELEEVLTPIRSATRLLALGIDYKKHHRFKKLVPKVLRYASGKTEIHFPSRANAVRVVDDLEFCIDFTIQTALNLQETE
jgi:hypothetical protein